MTRTLLAPCFLLGMLVASSNAHRYALETRHAATAVRGTRDARRGDVTDHMTHRRFVVSQRGRRLRQRALRVLNRVQKPPFARHCSHRHRTVA